MSYANDPKEHVPTMHDMVAFLFSLNEQAVHLIDFKSLVTSCQDLCYKLFHKVYEEREVPAEMDVMKKSWSSLIVYNYDVINHLANTGDQYLP